MRTDTTVRDVMHREFLGVSESDALADAAALLVDEGTDCLVVLRGGDPVGRLTARDALDALLDADEGDDAADGVDADSLTVGDVMDPPLPAVSPTDALAAVEERLVGEGVDRVVAVEGGEAVGVVTAADVLAAGTSRRGSGGRETGDAVAGDPRRDGAVVSSGAANADAEHAAGATMDPAATGATASSTAASAGATDDTNDGRDALGSDPPSGSPTQGVCENCGVLVPDLVTANGQAVCPNCREM